ncbi:carbonic anhydrase [Agrocybe pediades]|nr:carbonic anhydrase [Agrocybe pediades]
MLALQNIVLVSSLFLSAVAHPVHQLRELTIVGRDQSARVVRSETTAAAAAAGLEVLSSGNDAFRKNLADNDPQLLQKLATDGQAPPFMFLGCSDSRVSEASVFNAKPGTLFTQRNIANQYQRNDINAQSVLSYAVSELGVNHVIVMGHYGCGGVGAAIASAPTANVDAANGAVQNWIEPIREILQSSNRTELVELRTKNAGLAVVEEPDIKDPGFRALVEENVKASVRRIAADSVITNHFALLQQGESTAAERRASEEKPPQDVFIHGFVYDIETGIVQDLGVSVGPAGKAIPSIPFASVAKAAVESAAAHDSETPKPAITVLELPVIQARCGTLCKAKRSLVSLWY